jgi:hypothetical protein
MNSGSCGWYLSCLKVPEDRAGGAGGMSHFRIPGPVGNRDIMNHRRHSTCARVIFPFPPLFPLAGPSAAGFAALRDRWNLRWLASGRLFPSRHSLALRSPGSGVRRPMPLENFGTDAWPVAVTRRGRQGAGGIQELAA